ncbi:hypothetical protein EU538_12275 [Candidatus Thorarchaeota archaeon]|nr:MAG: hypothetical protein EU538_12275 [Candidatus Thorarchaeota archaeon]
MLDTWRDVARAGLTLLSVVIVLQVALVSLYLETLVVTQWLFLVTVVLALPAYVWVVRAYAMHPRGGNRTVIYGLMVLGLAGISLAGFSLGSVPVPPLQIAMQLVLFVHASGLFVGAVGSSKYERGEANDQG